MAKRLKTFWLLTAAVMGMTLVLGACGKTETHDHVWDEGTVTAAPTCTASGMKTYKCTVKDCKVTKSEPLPAAHRWVAQADNRLPSLYTDGEIHSVCAVCGTEKSETVKAHADFAEEFYTNISGATDWLYGYVSDYSASAETLDFTRIQSVKDSETAIWAAEGVEIGAGYIKSEGNAAVGFKFAGAVPPDVTANVSVSFTGKSAKTNLDAHLVWTDGAGTVKKTEELNKDGKKDWSFENAAPYAAVQGDLFYLVFTNKGEKSEASGSLTFTVSAPCVHIWDDGVEKQAVSCKQEGKVERTCLVCGVKFTDTVAKLPHTFNGDGEVTKEASCTQEGIRTKTCSECQETVTETIPKTPHDYVEDTVVEATTQAAGKVTYKCSHCEDVYEQTLAQKVEGQVADFKREFTTGIQREWKYGYGSWDFGANKYSFTQATEKNNEAWLVGGGVEIKGGWLRNEGGDDRIIIQYTYQENTAQDVKILVNFKGSNETDTGISCRLYVFDKDGNVKLGDLVYDFATSEFFKSGNTDAWGHSVKVHLEKGDYVGAFFWNEKSGWAHGSFDMTIYEATADMPFYNTSAVTDFQARGEGENGWAYGYTNDYDFGNNTYTFNHLNGKSGDNNGDYGGRRWYLENEYVEFFRHEVKSVRGGNAAIRYTMPEDQKVNIFTRFQSNSESIHLSGRILIQKADGTLVQDPTFIAGAGITYWEKTLENLQLEKGTTITLIFFNEASGEDPTGHYDFKITKA